MVNKIKRFFRSIGKPSGGSASLSGAYPVLASSDNQFHHLHEQQQYRSGGNNGRSLASSPLDSAGGMPVMMLRSAAEGSGSGSDSTGSSHRNGGGDGIRWSLLLPRIPRLVAEATAVSTSAASGSSSPVDDNVEMTMLLEMLTQMAPKEAQAQIRQFYIGDSSGAPASATIAASSSTPAAMIAGWEQRKVFRQCRRALLLCWKFIVAQLNDENAHITSELKETYFQLIGLIAERVEFNLSGDASSSSSAAASSSSSAAASGNASKNALSRQHATSGHMMGWTVNSPTASAAPTPLASSIDLTSDTNSAGSSGASSSDEGVDGERDLYLYRCLLVATFKYVVENIEGAKASKRSWITLAELRFFAKVLAICFFRIPVLQRMIIDQIYFAYRQKRWINTTTAATPSSDDNSSGGGSSRPTPPAASDSRVHRRRSSSRLGSGVTFTGSLSRWSEFEGHVLSESSGDGDDSSARDDMAAAESNQNVAAAAAAAVPSRATVDKFKRLNPTLFRWSRYAPYLAPYADSDVFRMNDAMKFSWLEKLSHDGEFFAVFMGYYTHHADVCAIGEPVWSCLPGYPLLIRVTLLLLKEACWNKWLFIRDNTVHSSPSALYDSPSAARDDREPFELRSIRGIRAVLDSVVHWLRNKELLESCTLALLECTNVLHSRCVTFCLTRSEAWFSAAATLVTGEGGQLVHRLPPSFSGQTFAIGVRHMLSSESFETLTQTLQFLYNRMDYFDGELRQSILKVLVQRHMFLFLHWHAEVRSCYHHVLVYKIIRVNRYFLDSPIDHLLIGRHAVLQLENSISIANGFDDFDDHLGGGAPYANVKSGGSSDSSGGGQQFHITAAEFSALRTEQALWRAFDACIGAICVHERRNAKEGNRRYQSELQCARSRAIAFQRLNRTPVDDLAPTSSMNEGLPGGKSWFELELLEEELHREPPYYLRYLPAEEVSSIDELRRLASTLRYPPELQVYAAASLRHYSSLLKKYYEELSRNRFVEAPPLGFE